jgi:hypothetical protein
MIDTIATQQTPEEKELARKYRYDNAVIMCLDMISKGCKLNLEVGINHQWKVQLFSDKYTAYTVITYAMGNEGFQALSNVYMAFINGRA